MGKCPVNCIDRHSAHSCSCANATDTVVPYQHPVSQGIATGKCRRQGIAGRKRRHPADEGPIRQRHTFGINKIHSKNIQVTAWCPTIVCHSFKIAIVGLGIIMSHNTIGTVSVGIDFCQAKLYLTVGSQGIERRICVT